MDGFRIGYVLIFLVVAAINSEVGGGVQKGRTPGGRREATALTQRPRPWYSPHQFPIFLLFPLWFLE